VPPATTTGTSGLVQTTQAFLASLVGSYAGADVLERGLQLRWDSAASITLPTIGAIAADWVGESQPFPHKQAVTAAGPTVHPYKLGVLTSLTGEMMRSSNAEALVRQVLLESLGPALDSKLFSNAAEVLGTSPAGLLAGVTPITASTATPLTEAMAADLSALAGAVSVVAGKGSVVYVAHPTQAMAVTVRTSGAVEVLASNSVTAKTVMAIATNAFAVALEDQPQVDASKESSFHRDTSPLPIVGDTGTVAYPVGSVYQTDSIGLKIRWPISWTIRDSRGVAVVNNVTW
jgi:hypothetical protein